VFGADIREQYPFYQESSGGLRKDIACLGSVFFQCFDMLVCVSKDISSVNKTCATYTVVHKLPCKAEEEGNWLTQICLGSSC